MQSLVIPTQLPRHVEADAAEDVCENNDEEQHLQKGELGFSRMRSRRVPVLKVGVQGSNG